MRITLLFIQPQKICVHIVEKIGKKHLIDLKHIQVNGKNHRKLNYLIIIIINNKWYAFAKNIKEQIIKKQKSWQIWPQKNTKTLQDLP